MNIHIQGFVWTHIFISLGWPARNEIAGYVESVCILIRYHHTVFQSAEPFYIPTTNVWDIQLLHICLHLVLSAFKILPILVGPWWCLIMILVCNSLMNSDAEHLFICLFATHTSSFMKCLFKYFACGLPFLLSWRWTTNSLGDLGQVTTSLSLGFLMCKRWKKMVFNHKFVMKINS